MHTHSYEDFYFDETQNGMTLEETSFETNGIRMQNKITNSDGLHDHTYSGDTTFVGSGQAHENRPPYYVLAFIMKL
jgi:hypothetical protein